MRSDCDIHPTAARLEPWPGATLREYPHEPKPPLKGQERLDVQVACSLRATIAARSPAWEKGDVNRGG